MSEEPTKVWRQETESVFTDESVFGEIKRRLKEERQITIDLHPWPNANGVIDGFYERPSDIDNLRDWANWAGYCFKYRPDHHQVILGPPL